MWERTFGPRLQAGASLGRRPEAGSHVQAAISSSGSRWGLTSANDEIEAALADHCSKTHGVRLHLERGALARLLSKAADLQFISQLPDSKTNRESILPSRTGSKSATTLPKTWVNLRRFDSGRLTF